MPNRDMGSHHGDFNMASHGSLTISEEHSDEILKEMCNRVGQDYETFDFKDPQWFLKHSWTREEEEDFRIWLGKFLKKHKYVGSGTKRGQDWGYYEAGKLLGNYGWRTKEVI